mgnify:CR=1 FL=1
MLWTVDTNGHVMSCHHVADQRDSSSRTYFAEVVELPHANEVIAGGCYDTTVPVCPNEGTKKKTRQEENDE